MRNLILLAIAIVLAYFSIVAYFSVKMVDSFAAADPTNFAPDIFTIWTIDYSNPSLPITTFIAQNLSLTHTYNVDAPIPSGQSYKEWRGGLLVGDEASLDAWVEAPGEMAAHWRSEAGVNSRLFKSSEGFVLEKASNEIIVWEDELRIPKHIFDRGGIEISSEDSDLIHKYAAVVPAPGGTFLAVDLGDRYAWVFDESTTGAVAANQETLNEPQAENLLGVIMNHRTRVDMDILFDEVRSVVEAIAGGKVVWTKKVTSPPIGKAYEVDIYANGKYQTAFATSDAVYLIDVKGNKVKGFPFKSRSAITGFSVMDYDKNRKYRFLIATADGKVTNLKGEGKRTSGWNFAKLDGGVNVEHIHHLRVGSKDYIYAGCSNGSVKLLKRTGGVRASTDIHVHPAVVPAFRLSSNISKSSVLFVDEGGTLRELTFGEDREVGMSGLVKADRVEVLDTDLDGKKDVVVYYRGKRTVWNSRNEQISP